MTSGIIDKVYEKESETDRYELMGRDLAPYGIEAIEDERRRGLVNLYYKLVKSQYSIFDTNGELSAMEILLLILFHYGCLTKEQFTWLFPESNPNMLGVYCSKSKYIEAVPYFGNRVYYALTEEGYRYLYDLFPPYYLLTLCMSKLKPENPVNEKAFYRIALTEVAFVQMQYKNWVLYDWYYNFDTVKNKEILNAYDSGYIIRNDQLELNGGTCTAIFDGLLIGNDNNVSVIIQDDGSKQYEDIVKQVQYADILFSRFENLYIERVIILISIKPDARKTVKYQAGIRKVVESLLSYAQDNGIKSISDLYNSVSGQKIRSQARIYSYMNSFLQAYMEDGHRQDRDIECLSEYLDSQLGTSYPEAKRKNHERFEYLSDRLREKMAQWDEMDNDSETEYAEPYFPVLITTDVKKEARYLDLEKSGLFEEFEEYIRKQYPEQKVYQDEWCLSWYLQKDEEDQQDQEDYDEEYDEEDEYTDKRYFRVDDCVKVCFDDDREEIYILAEISSDVRQYARMQRILKNLENGMQSIPHFLFIVKSIGDARTFAVNTGYVHITGSMSDRLDERLASVAFVEYGFSWDNLKPYTLSCLEMFYEPYVEYDCVQKEYVDTF